tara:strand:- start:1316 stop:1990 length:675 start_codon:yes stop_codon:yes gene_type:complete
MCGPAAPAAIPAAGMLAGAAAPAAVAAAGPGLMAVGTAAAGPGLMALGSSAVPGAIGFAPLGASFASSAAPAFSFGSLFSGLSGVGDAISILSPLASAFQSMNSAGDLAELGRMQTQSANIQLTQDIIEQRMIELERRERANQEIAGLLAGGQAGQSLVALTRKRLDDSARSAQFSETRLGAIGVTGSSRIASQDRRTKTAMNAAFSEAGKGVGQSVGFLAGKV